MPQLNTPSVFKLEMFYVNWNDSYIYIYIYVLFNTKNNSKNIQIFWFTL